MKTTTNNTSNVLRQLFGGALVLVMVASFGGALPSIVHADGACGSGTYDSGNGCLPYSQPPVVSQPVTSDYGYDDYSYDDYDDYDYSDDYSDYNDYSDSGNYYSFGLGLNFNNTKNTTTNYGYTSPTYTYQNTYQPYSYGDYNPTHVTYVYDNQDYTYGDYHSPKPVPTCNITANDTSVEDGDSVTLNWSANNATSGSISNIGSVGTSGSRSVQVNGDTTYVYSVNGEGGSSTCSVNVNVDENNNESAPSCSLDVDDDSITEGDSTILRWHMTGNADSASINEGIGSVDVGSGSEHISPDSDTTYRMTVRGDGGSRTCTTSVDVGPDDQTNVSLNITPTTPGNQPYTSVYLADAPYTGAGDIYEIIGSILAIIAAAAIGGYFLFMKGLPFAFKRATVNNAPVAASETKKTQAKAIRVGGLDQSEVYAFMSAYAANDVAAMQSIRASLKASGVTEDRLASRVSLAATDALTARKFGGATENALLAIDEATLTALAA